MSLNEPPSSWPPWLPPSSAAAPLEVELVLGGTSMEAFEPAAAREAALGAVARMMGVAPERLAISFHSGSVVLVVSVSAGAPGDVPAAEAAAPLLRSDPGDVAESLNRALRRHLPAGDCLTLEVAPRLTLKRLPCAVLPPPARRPPPPPSPCLAPQPSRFLGAITHGGSSGGGGGRWALEAATALRLAIAATVAVAACTCARRRLTAG